MKKNKTIEVTKTYYIDDRDLMKAVVLPTNDYIKKVIGENNEKWEIWRDWATHRTLIRAENKPRNCPVYNIFWKELNEEN